MLSMSETPIDIKAIQDRIRSIPDFPKQGILFRDITPILKDPKLFKDTISWYARQLENQQVDYIIGIESRGFILGAALAHAMNKGFVLARKRGKLPGLVERHKYDLEYGSDCIEMHTDAIPAGSNVVIVDDLLATGGTATATINLVRQLQGNVVMMLFMIELVGLHGRQNTGSTPICSMITFDM